MCIISNNVDFANRVVPVSALSQKLAIHQAGICISQQPSGTKLHDIYLGSDPLR